MCINRRGLFKPVEIGILAKSTEGRDSNLGSSSCHESRLPINWSSSDPDSDVVCWS